MKLGNLKTMF